MDTAALARAMVFPLRAVPAVLFGVFAGVIGLIALACPQARRADGLALARLWTEATVALVTGHETARTRTAARRPRADLS